MHLSFFNSFVLITIQKMAPLFVLVYLVIDLTIQGIFSMMAAISSIIGGIGGYNQTQIRTLLAYSSIGHTGWLGLASVIESHLAWLYFFVYIAILFGLMVTIWLNNLVSVGFKLNETFLNLFLVIQLLTLGGLPPTVGFTAK